MKKKKQFTTTLAALALALSCLSIPAMLSSTDTDVPNASATETTNEETEPGIQPLDDRDSKDIKTEGVSQ